MEGDQVPSEAPEAKDAKDPKDDGKPKIIPAGGIAAAGTAAADKAHHERCVAFRPTARTRAGRLCLRPPPTGGSFLEAHAALRLG